VNVLRSLGLADNAFDINNVLLDDAAIWRRIESILDNLTDARKKVAQGVDAIMQTNINVLRSLFAGDDE
jgi:phage-related protein